MNQYQAFILKEMGITLWLSNQSLDQPIKDDLSAADAPLIIDDETEIVILAESDVLQSEFVSAVLKSMGLTVAQAQVVTQECFLQYQGPLPLWVWSTQSPLALRRSTQVINSASIEQVSQDPLQKRGLWQQIKSYQTQ
ncbi:DNA polymerase III subunit psi [Motilimonas sp. E26]|uniref:DNA polymerase III subunit psi n=1 Tax=Motilimonas sp. E26 TaxID=2865674 RepID=UPI001E2A84E2|nr:DNA polymerase III subunit psi [Motilimonas sp. E26]MCE0558227.1 DNA polymerase III subunit psi [Motilimonas sp. E26]